MKKVYLLFSITLLYSNLSLGCSESYLSSLDSGSVSIGDSNGAFTNIDINSDLNFMGFNIKSGSKVVCNDSLLYSIDTDQNMSIDGYPISSGKTVFSTKVPKKPQIFTLSQAHSFENINWPAGSRVSLHIPAITLRNGDKLTLRHVTISEDMMVNGKEYKAGTSLSYSSLNGKVRELKHQPRD